MGNLLPFVGMMMAILVQSGGMLVIKVAMTDGMNKYVMVVYSFALSSLILLPFVLLLHRSERPPLTFSSLCSFFMLGLIGCSANILAYVGIDFSSPNLASAILSLIPAFTFVLALIFRVEVVRWRQFSCQVKVIGTVVSIAGAFILTFYKGPPIVKMHSLESSNNILLSPQLNWTLGGLFLAGDSFMSSIWYIYQSLIAKKYSDVKVIVFFQILFSTIISAVFALIVVKDPKAWVLELDMGLIAILYQAIAGTVIRYILTTWCVHRAGPLFCAMFKPTAIIFTVLMGEIFLGDNFHHGSLIGAVIIVVGFYAVMWGKATENRKVVERGVGSLESSCHNAPLLQNEV